MGRLIREGASTLTSGGSGATPPADVTGLVATHQGFTEPDADGKRNAIIHVAYSAPVGWIGKGIHVFIEAPDGSGSNPRARLGAFELGADALAPDFQPFDAGKFPYDATNNTPAIIELDAPTAPESWRVYAVSYTTEIENDLKPATELGAPPSALVTVNPPGFVIIGEEWAFNVTNFTAVTEYSLSEAGDDIARLVTTWSNLPDDSRRFGVEIIMRPKGTSGGSDVNPSGIVSAGTQAWASEWWPVGADYYFSVYCVSVSRTNGGEGDDLRNTIVDGVTPRVKDLFFVRQAGPAGQEFAPFITGFEAHVIDAGKDEIGGQRYRIVATIVRPTVTTRYRGTKFILRPSGGTGATDIEVGTIAAEATTFQSEPYPMPDVAESYTLYAVSMDANNRANTITGSTPFQIINLLKGAGSLLLNRADTSSFNSAEFEIVASEFQAKLFAAQKIVVGSVLRVGGGTGGQAPTFSSNGQIAVYNGSNVLRAWMGQNGSVYGGWFGELYVGGTGVTDAPLYSNSSGVVFIGGNLTGTPYITIRNNANVEVGRIGANIDISFHGAWFKQVRVGGPNISNPVIQSDASGNVTITGAEFTVVSGTVTVNIGATNKIRVTDTAFNSFSQVLGSQVRVESSLNSNRFAQITFDSFQCQNIALNTADLSAGTGLRFNGVQVVNQRKTGWTAATGFATRSGFNTTTVTLSVLAEHVKALIDDLHSAAGHGLIGT